MESVIATREEVLHFLSGHQLICGYGLASGSGYGYGDGFGFATADGSIEYDNGSGRGSIDSFSFGYGDDDSFGCGSAYGCGYSDSTGYGTGKTSPDDGFGFGYENIKVLNGNIVDYIDSIPTIITQVRDNISKGYIIKMDLTFKPCYIARVGNSFAHGKTIRKAVEDAEKKEIRNMPIEELIKKFVKTFGSIDSEHTGKEFYDWHNFLTGSCTFGRDEFCKANNIDLEKKYTVKYFLDITKESYRSDIIKMLREEYKIEE